MATTAVETGLELSHLPPATTLRRTPSVQGLAAPSILHRSKSDASIMTRQSFRRASSASTLPSVTENSPELATPVQTTPEYSGSLVRFFWICLALVLVLTLGGLDGNIVATAVPSITDYFHTVADVGWYASAYRLCSCATQFLFGRLYKIFSTKRVLLATIVIFLVGSIICATATTSPTFVLGRAITGVGFAGINAGYLSVACQILPLRKRPVFNGVMAGIESISVIAAPIIGGIITQKLSWKWCFWINLPVGAISLVAIMFALPERTTASAAMTWKQILRELDLVGTLVLIPCLTTLFVALSWAGIRYSWSDPKIIGCFVAFAGLLFIFSIDQYISQERATLPPRILMNRNVIAGAIFSACTNGSEAVLEYYLPTYFQAVRGVSPAESGYLMLPIMVGFLVALLIQGSGTTILGYYTPFMLAASVLMPIAAGLITTWQLDTGIVRILGLCAFAGFSTGIGFQGPQSAVQTTLPDADASTGLAVILFAQGFGPAVFLAAAQTIFTNRLTSTLYEYAPGLDVKAVESMGINEIKTNFGQDRVSEVAMAFNKSLTQTWYLTVGTACMTMVGSILTDWRSVKSKRT